MFQECQNLCSLPLKASLVITFVIFWQPRRLNPRWETAGHWERRLAPRCASHHCSWRWRLVTKRSHKQSYNAKSGVAVIFWQKTKKLLFPAVRNKFCSVCKIAARGNLHRSTGATENGLGPQGQWEMTCLQKGSECQREHMETST